MDTFRSGDLVFDLTDAGPPDGEVIVLLHGFPQSRHCWAGVIPRLAGAGYRVLAPDQRGYSAGARPTGRRAYRMDRLVGDVVALADAVEAPRVHVVGHDWGGAVAWAMASSHHQRLHSLTSLATPHPRALLRSMVTSGQALRSWYMVVFQLPVLPELAFGPAAALTRRSLRASGLSSGRVDEYLAGLRPPGAATGALNWYRGIPFSRVGSGGGPVSVPSLYVYGTGDVALGRAAADLTGRHVGAPYRYEVLDGVSHWIPEEVPDTVAGLVIDHARRYGGVAP